MNSRGTSVATAGHLPPLDGVRGMAVLVVIIHNSAWIAGPSEQLLMKLTNAMTAAGWAGVSLFFTLSGFLITGILLDSKGGARFFRFFYLRRTLRIFPLYYAFIASTFLIGPLLAWSPQWVEAVRKYQWTYWIYQSNWPQAFGHSVPGSTHLWSLAVEEQFYLVWPLVVWLLTRRGLIGLCSVMVLGTPLIRLGMRYVGLPQEAVYLFTIARWDALAVGALVVALLRDDRGRVILARWQGSVSAAALLALAILIAVQHGFHSDDLPIQVIGQSLVAILSASLIAYAVQNATASPTWLQASLSWPALRTFGKYSYAMYVFHFPIHQSLSPLLTDSVRGADTPMRLVRLVAYIVLVITLSFLAAKVSWRLIEKPFLDLKDRIAPRAA